MIKIISRGFKNGSYTAQIVQLRNGKSQTRHLVYDRKLETFFDSFGIPYKSVDKPK